MKLCKRSAQSGRS